MVSAVYLPLKLKRKAACLCVVEFLVSYMYIRLSPLGIKLTGTFMSAEKATNVQVPLFICRIAPLSSPGDEWRVIVVYDKVGSPPKNIL